MKKESLAERIARAKESTGPGLAAASDVLNASIVKVEQALVELGFGVESSVTIERTDDWSCDVGFRRHGRTWQLTYEFYNFDDPESGPDIKPLLTSSRDERLEASEHLEDLVDEIIRTAEDLSARVRSRAEKLEALADDLRGARNQITRDTK